METRIVDLIPLRRSPLALWCIAAVAIIATLECLYAWMPSMATATTDGQIAAFDLDGEGSLAVWFSSATLSLAFAVTLLIYRMRKQAVDDYQGKYRVWLWAALCWLVLGIDETSSLHEGFKEMMVQLTGQRILGDGSIWWAIPYAVVLGVVGLKLWFEMRPYRLSRVAFAGAAACYIVAVITQMGGIMPESGARGVMIEEGCEMAGNVLLLLAMTLHARYLILVASGVISEVAEEPKSADARTKPTKASKPQAATASSASSAKAKAKRGRTATAAAESHKSPAKPTAKPKRHQHAEESTIDDGDSYDDWDEDVVTRVDERRTSTPRRKLSKRERKALRKRQQAEREDW